MDYFFSNNQNFSDLFHVFGVYNIGSLHQKLICYFIVPSTLEDFTAMECKMIEKKTDQKLVKSFQAGDKNAFNELQRRYQDKIYYLILKYQKNPEVANDLCQEVFLRAFLRLNTFSGGAKFYTWLYKIAVNICIDFHRKRSLTTVSFDDMTPSAKSVFRTEDSQSPLSILERKELSEKVREAISNLPPKQKSALILRYYGDLQIKEIAMKVGCSQGTIKAQLFHAKQKLAKMLNGYFKDGEDVVVPKSFVSFDH